MSLSADALFDRLQLKRQITKWRILAIVAVVLALMAASKHDMVTGGKTGGDYIARLTIDGVVGDDRDRDALLVKLRKSEHVKAVVVWMDTPGGSAVGGMDTYRLLRKISESGKPVVVVMRDLSASAGFLIAMGADRVYANEATLTGSIGVIIEGAEFTNLAEKLGVTPLVVKTGAMKDAFSPLSKTSPEAKAVMQGVVDDFFHTFVATVAERRHLPYDYVMKLADGRVYTGNQAVQYKLIDALGGEDEALAWLHDSKHLSPDLKIKDVEITRPEHSLLHKLLGSSIEKILPIASGKLDGLVLIWHPGVQLQ